MAATIMMFSMAGLPRPLQSSTARRTDLSAKPGRNSASPFMNEKVRRKQGFSTGDAAIKD